ncbi:MAG: nucleotide exchange factor GrpE [Microbacteriaceae bacterium]|nr:nucleotide exchange factor GrpE [Microbacteriaceae bacterium]
MSEEQKPEEQPEQDPQENLSEEAEAEPEVSDDSVEEEPNELDRELEIFQDLQRLRADFVNYKNRVERDKLADRQASVIEVVRAFLPAMDDIDRAESHGDIEEGSALAAVSVKLRQAAEKFGLERFGEKGEKFDPSLHDALVQTPSAEVSEATIADVIEVGYRIGEREVRPAKVAVFVPNEG